MNDIIFIRQSHSALCNIRGCAVPTDGLASGSLENESRAVINRSLNHATLVITASVVGSTPLMTPVISERQVNADVKKVMN